jgi:hypothetical protein
MKKVAFIGCSYSSYTQFGQQENSWTWLLAQRFPQHIYRNYALGGRGPDYFRWALLDAKIWGADVVFVNSTHRGRISFLVYEGLNLNEDTAWKQEHISDNYSTMIFLSPYVWIGTGSANHMCIADHSSAFKKFTQQAVEYMSTSQMLEQQQIEWYKQVPHLYNFDDIFLLNFDKSGRDFSSTHSKSVWEILMRVSGANSNHHQDLYTAGICLATDDDHWTPYGNKIVLDQYVLTPEVISALS